MWLPTEDTAARARSATIESGGHRCERVGRAFRLLLHLDDVNVVAVEFLASLIVTARGRANETRRDREGPSTVARRTAVRMRDIRTRCPLRCLVRSGRAAAAAL